MTLPNLGDRVAFQTTTGRAFGTVSGFGLRDEDDRSHSIVLVDLDRAYRGEVIPPEWPQPGPCPTIQISVIACNPDLLEDANGIETDREPLDLAVCKHCGIDIERAEPDASTWVDAGTGPAARLVFCNDQDETHDGIRHEPID